MAVLAKRSGVPAATIKHYIREGLLPAPEKRTSRNMAYYDAALVPRITTIKELQRTRFLPLKVIKEILDEGAELSASDPTEAASAIARTLERMAPSASRSRAELVAAGVPASELEWFCELGVVRPKREGDREVFVGDDLALLQTLGAARRAGITPEMLPFTALGPYADAIRHLVKVELSMFKEGVLPRAGKNLPALVEAATTLSERLVVLLRRRFILPMFRELVAEGPSATSTPKRAEPTKRKDREEEIAVTSRRRSNGSRPRSRSRSPYGTSRSGGSGS
jgi:DNA-binding transcriptional MerR regulator